MTPNASMGHESRRRSAPDHEKTHELLTDALVQRFHVAAGLGASASSSAVTELTRRAVKAFLQKLVVAMVAYMKHDHRADLRLVDVTRACGYYGIHIYGYDDTIVLRHGSCDEVVHVTELVEMHAAFDEPEQAQSEPDLEPIAQCAKSHLAQNQTAKEWSTNDEMEHDEDDESDEWSWYDDSDAESSDDDEDMREYLQCKKVRPWQWTSTNKPEPFLASSQRAQELASEQSLLDADKMLEPEEEAMDSESTVHQEYDSKFDEVQFPANVLSWKRKVNEQPSIYHIEDLLTTELEDANLYVISRHAFFEIFQSLLGCILKISPVALNALHSATERYLTRSLTNGVLRNQIQALVVEESAQELQDKLQLTSKKIAVPPRHVEVAQQDDDVTMAVCKTPCRSNPESPGKRKPQE